jgi:uncharacterized membrane protein YedE/YeeE
MKSSIYLLSGAVFGLGLSISGMIDPTKVKSFLFIGSPDWSPALIFVLGAAVPVYFILFQILRRREKTLNGSFFGHPPARPVDRKLIIGSAVFGAGWGVAGICPGPSLVHLAFLDLNFFAFIIAMLAGVELQRRLA